MKMESLCLELIARNAKLTANVSFLSRQVEIYKSLYLGEIDKNLEKENKNEKI